MNELIEILKFLFLGIFQGFTEPLPISSSGHLLMARSLMEIKLPLTFEGFINFGSLIAVIAVYRKDLYNLALNGSQFLFQRKKEHQHEFQYLLLLFIATIPAGVLGLLFEDFISSLLEERLSIVGITLILTGLALWIIRNLQGFKDDRDITYKDAVIVGFAQAVALFPGISRSGATIVAAMLLNMKRSSALRFSFLMYIPVSIGTMIFAVEDIIGDEAVRGQLTLYIIALVGAIFASYFALLLFINVMKSGNLKYFAFYCWIVGLLAFILL
ncbi:UDP pyrophosphate phosphatase [Halalkalibacillus sediminis]|uniref:Undecaprenyl-diphosphatase n=1 Tax=Halalkalibacillus sediminis TaxID=2018042 RepID=A0A2I0QVF8_9BACI|nr:undecaprenyl-diphosphate phosphatase [Halalkalibacillus sediminis]PKR78333.1 UDP pyrophosphate phosphatase [Halalkalibacillus sediminis]